MRPLHVVLIGSLAFSAMAERLDVEMAPKRIYRTQLKIV